MEIRKPDPSPTIGWGLARHGEFRQTIAEEPPQHLVWNLSLQAVHARHVVPGIAGHHGLFGGLDEDDRRCDRLGDRRKRLRRFRGSGDGRILRVGGRVSLQEHSRRGGHCKHEQCDGCKRTPRCTSH